MGNGIAQAAAQAGFSVILYELSTFILEKAKNATSENLQMLVDKEKISADEREKITRRIHYTNDIQTCFASSIIVLVVISFV